LRRRQKGHRGECAQEEAAMVMEVMAVLELNLVKVVTALVVVKRFLVVVKRFLVVMAALVVLMLMAVALLEKQQS
jgi:hypothetical protein